MKNTKVIFCSILFITFFILTTSVLSASPILTLNSPSNITYNTTKVQINITSNEPVNFYSKSAATTVLLKANATSYESVFYGKTGNFNRVIYANNSNGEANKTISFRINASNPINVTECGEFVSGNAKYQLMNDINGGCINWNEQVNNISFNLNGYKIESNNFAPISSQCYFSEIFNGTLNQTAYVGNGYGALDIQGGDFCLLKDLRIESVSNGISIYIIDDLTLENVNITSPNGIFIYDGHASMHIKKTNFVGSINGIGETGISNSNTEFAPVILENVTFKNYTTKVSPSGGLRIEYTVRNTNLEDPSDFSIGYGISRYIVQHLVIINLTNQTGSPVSGAIEIIEEDYDTNNPPVLEKIDSNPTAHVFAATNESGIAEVYLTEKIVIGRVFSPPEVEDINFGTYILTARSAEVVNDTEINFEETNSTIKVGIPLHQNRSPSIPQCTISQMLDLNNDGLVDARDALIVIRKKAGYPVSFNSTKGCEGINLNPF